MAVSRIPYLGKDTRAEKIKPVVLVYLIATIDRVPHLLLMRRGAQLAYMRNMWSIISGFLNESVLPRRQALIEISGETGLLGSEVTQPELVGRYIDQDRDKTWIRHLMIAQVQPHVGGLDNKHGITLDYEHREAAWMPVSYILDRLDGRPINQDRVARAILYKEKATPDFLMNLGRIRARLEQFVAPPSH